MRSGQCIFPTYSGYLPVLRTCSDHSTEVFKTSMKCSSGSLEYSLAEYPGCEYDCEYRSPAQCSSCMDPNLCTQSCLKPASDCQACTNPHYFQCSGYCIHPDLVCDGQDHCPDGEDEDLPACQDLYQTRGINTVQNLLQLVNRQMDTFTNNLNILFMNWDVTFIRCKNSITMYRVI